MTDSGLTVRRETDADAAPAVAEATNGKAGPDVDIKALLRSSRRPERTVPICLRGDLVAAFEDLDRQLAAEAEPSPGDVRLNNTSRGKAQNIAAQLAALREEMTASTVAFRLRALPRKRWLQLKAEHPPRKGDDGKVIDADALGVNGATFFAAAVRRCVVEPVLDAAGWALLLDAGDDDEGGGLTEHQFDQLAGMAWRVNEHEVDIPFSRAASRILRAGEPT